MPTPTRKSTVAELQKLLFGVQKNLSGATLVIAGISYGGPQLAAFVSQALASAVGIQQAHANLTDAIMADEKLQLTIGRQVRGLKDIAQVMFSTQHTTLAEFGLLPRKARTPLSTEALLLRAERVRATRKARNTKGAKQKRAIKGNVIGVTITPVVTATAAPGGSIEADPTAGAEEAT
jgi:hypothetical protein